MTKTDSLLLSCLLAFSSYASAHSGGLDANGGHFNRQTGEYHCHREGCEANRNFPEETVGPAVSLYNRSEWKHWIDQDNDCQDTRAEVLIAHSLVAVAFRDLRNCVVSSGLWIDSYTGERYTNAQELDIDHLVPLAWAHGHGGEAWNASQKEAFANDIANLTVVHASINRSKGSQGPDDWLPESSTQACIYLAEFNHIVTNYGLRIENNERESIQLIKKHCE